MIHPDTEVRFISDEIGYGVVATKFIPKGTITWVADKLDRRFTQQEFDQLEPVYKDILEKYTFRDKNGDLILCWDNSRFVNHSFNSNCLSTAYNFEIAVRDIQPGEQLTDDYGYLNVTEPFDCLPEEGSERTRVYPDDLLNFHHLWDSQLLEVIPLLTEIAQPLRDLFSQSHWEKVMRVSTGQEKMESILSCYYSPKKQKAS